MQCEALVMNTSPRRLSWPDFCDWLKGRRVVREYVGDEGVTILTFEDGSQAYLTSQKSEPTLGYSELTPGSDGHLLPPFVSVEEP